MPRANRHYIPGYVWHIANRCHKKEFLHKDSVMSTVSCHSVLDVESRTRRKSLKILDSHFRGNDR